MCSGHFFWQKTHQRSFTHEYNTRWLFIFSLCFYSPPIFQASPPDTINNCLDNITAFLFFLPIKSLRFFLSASRFYFFVLSCKPAGPMSPLFLIEFRWQKRYRLIGIWENQLHAPYFVITTKNNKIGSFESFFHTNRKVVNFGTVFENYLKRSHISIVNKW